MAAEANDIRIRRANPTEAGLLTDIARASKRYWGYPERNIVLWKSELTVTPSLITDNPVFAVVKDEEVAGFYALRCAGGSAEVEHFWVAPQFIGCGIGAAMYAHLLRTAGEVRARRVRIVSDPNAEGFYLKMGARRVGEEASMPAGRTLPVLVEDVP